MSKDYERGFAKLLPDVAPSCGRDWGKRHPVVTDIRELGNEALAWRALCAYLKLQPERIVFAGVLFTGVYKDLTVVLYAAIESLGREP